jgi:translation initiation factor IF-1
MAKNDVVEITGKVIDVLPNSTFRVKMDDSAHEMICYLSGKLRQHKIKIVLGDNVRVEVSPYDLDRGRISFRL